MATDRRIRRLLVANRGEIARRVQRTCRELGITTVAVYSDPDAGAPFVREADLAVPLGGATPAETYLQIGSVIDAARRARADAIHPGYGFLSENAEFAAACQAVGIAFVGPSVEAIEVMGSKLASRDLMAASGVPVLPGADLTGLHGDEILDAADHVGWPVLVKASFGGGGRGMRVVHAREELLAAVESAARESGSAFGDDTVFLERYVERSRHVEIQVIGDEFGNIVSLHERECSIQRRHQKIIEEAPSPAVDVTLRKRIATAAVTAAEAIDYVGAGTVEFLLTPDGEFFFLEMNTRLQVEHPVTELVTGIDLVRLQLLVAEGRELPAEVHSAPIVGHAIEVRLYAEDPAADFMPVAGTLHDFTIPTTPGIRVDSGFESGSVIGINYDPMLAKVIAHAPTRSEAARALAGVLDRSRIHGVTTNRDLLIAILGDEQFLAGAIDTQYLERHPPVTLVARRHDEAMVSVGAVAAAVARQALRRADATVQRLVPSGFRNAPSQMQTESFTYGDRELRVSYRLDRRPRFEVNGAVLENVVLDGAFPSGVALLVDGVRWNFAVHSVECTCFVDTTGFSGTYGIVPRFPNVDGSADAGSLVAPMPGSVVRVEVNIGAVVSAGDLLLVVEAMKMEHRIVAPTGGIVAEIRVSAGDVVDEGQVLAVVDEGVES